MITKEQITQLAEEFLTSGSLFLVEVSVQPGNVITIEVDSPSGVTVGECVELNRAIEEQLDRETEDYELNVSSPGLEKPFRVTAQYLKNVGRQVAIDRHEGPALTGLLKEAGENEIEVEVTSREKVEGKKSKQTVVRTHRIPYSEIKQTKVVISFK